MEVMPSRVSSPILVGRHEELERMLANLRGDSPTEHRLIVVAGEAGVGKTRFVDEVGTRARQLGFQVLAGGCINLSGAYPYAPFVEALRDLSRNLPPDPIERLPELGDGELGRLLFPAGLPATAEAQAGLSYSSPQASLFEGLLRFLMQMAETAPVLVLIEDLHWADRSSLDLLSFLARNVRTDRLTLLATYRTDEVVRKHPLTPFLAELERSGRAERVTLARLGRKEMAQLLTAIQGGKPEPHIVDQIYARSEGNPFFAEELLATGSPSGRLPETLREVLLTRAASLTGRSQDLLGVASAAGRRVSGTLLATVSARKEEDLLPALREAVAHQILIVEESGTGEEDEYVFRHALMQEAVYANLLPGERTRLHESYAQALADTGELKGDTSTAGELAHHWYAAHDLPRALESSVQAGLNAELVFAFPEAQAHYERALELWDRVPNPTVRAGMDRVSLLESAARAAAVIGPSRAIAHLLSAVEIVDPDVDPGRAGLLQERLGQYRWMAGDSDGALAAFQEAVRLVPAEPPSLARARALAGLAQVLMVYPRVEESRPIAEEAVVVAQAVDAVDVEAHALNTLGMDMGYMGEVETGLTNLNRSLEIALALGDVDNASRAYINLTDLLVNVGRFEEAAAIGLDGVTFDEHHGLIHIRIFGACETAVALHRLGRWAEAGKILERAQQLQASGVAEIFLQLRLAALEVGRGELEAAEKRLDHTKRLCEKTPDTQWVAPLSEYRAELAIWLGQPESAREVVGQGLGILTPLRGSQVQRQGPIYTLGIRAEADLAAFARAQQEGADLRESRLIATGYLAGLQAVAEETRRSQPAFAPLTEAYLSLGLGEVSRLEGQSDPSTWSDAASAWQALAMPYAEAYARFRQAEAVLQRHGARATALEAIRRARQLAHDLGAAPLLREVEGLAKRSRLELDEESPQDLVSLVDPVVRYGLTPREREVLERLASGHTNRQIAEQLFISEKTASVHVSNILRKLSATSRTEAAGIAYRLHLIAASSTED